MTLEESMARADEILRAAGWTPTKLMVTAGGEPQINTHGRFAIANLVCGHPPEGAGAAFVVKEVSKIPQGMAAELGLDPVDYPDEPHEAAAWLVARYAAPPPAPGSEPEPEPEAEPQIEGADVRDGQVDDYGGGAGPLLTATFGDDALLAELADAETTFVFGDNLAQKRTAAIGLVVQYAALHMPAWTEADTIRLNELRNFAMGVSEGRWPNDAAMQAGLEVLEGVERTRRRWETARDAKVAHLIAADRSAIEAFALEAGWP